MRYFLLFLLLFPFFSIAQDEFDSDSPFMYDASTMVQLKSIVDSLNLKFKTCELDSNLRSKRQAHGWQVKLEGKKSKDLEQFLKDKPTIEDLRNTFPKAKVFRSVLVEYAYEDRDKEKHVRIYAYPGETSMRFDDNEKSRKKLSSGEWVSSYSKYQKDESIRAFYFEEDLTTYKIPEEYSRMIQYVDCMVDTNLTVMHEDAERGRFTKLPENYRSMSLKKKKKLLNDMRKTRVVGGCSMDNSPRVHARNIAILSAETLEWEVFLRSHLDVMNDSFERMSDGSYAWGGRGTYIKELEEIDIDILSLILGISLRIDKPAENHYYGSIGRIGRALSESDQLNDFHSIMSKMMNDASLDDFNKILIYYLWKNANAYASDEDRSKVSRKLKEVVAGLPEYFSEYVDLNTDQ